MQRFSYAIFQNRRIKFMLKKPFFKRIASIFLAIVMLMTFMIPAFASGGGFDDLATVIDLTGGNSQEPETPYPSSGDNGDGIQSGSDSGGNDSSEVFDSGEQAHLEQGEAPV